MNAGILAWAWTISNLSRSISAESIFFDFIISEKEREESGAYT